MDNSVVALRIYINVMNIWKTSLIYAGVNLVVSKIDYLVVDPVAFYSIKIEVEMTNITKHTTQYKMKTY